MNYTNVDDIVSLNKITFAQLTEDSYKNVYPLYRNRRK